MSDANGRLTPGVMLTSYADQFRPAAKPAAVVHAEQLGLRFAPGARVLDHVTGSEGTVVSGEVVHGLKSVAPKPGATEAGALLHLPTPTTTELYQVAFDQGGTVLLTSDALVALPAGLTVPLEDFHLG